MALAAHVVAHARMRAALSRDPRGRLRRGHALRRALPKQQYPHAIESDYARALVAIVDTARHALAPLVHTLPELLKAAAAARGDAAELARRTVAGLTVAIENPAGSVRRWVDSDGTRGETTMAWDYGYLIGFDGADGEEVDVYLGPDPNPSSVFVVHQQNKSTGFVEYDEDKVMLGWSTPDEAIRAYLAQYNDPRFFGGMTRWSIGEFRRQLVVADGERLSRAGSWRADVGETSRLRMLLDHARSTLDRALDVSQLERLARRHGDTVTKFQREQLARQTRAAIGVDVVTLDRKVPEMIEHFVSENVQLIKSLGNKYLDDVGKIASRAFTTGTRAESIESEIADRYGISVRHARLIARDQVGKLNGQVNAARQRELGITSFIWRTVGDERVRDEHRELDGKTFEYSNPPAEGLPGEPILCRCSAEPDMSPLVDEIDDEQPEDDGAA